MGARQFIKAAVTVVVCAFAAACVTVRAPVSTPETATDEKTLLSPALPQENRDFAEALAHYGEAIRSDIHDDHAAAMSNYVAAATLDSSNDALQFRVALALLQDKRTDEAIALMEKSAKTNPKSERALIWLAMIYRSASLDDKSLDTYRRVIAIAPTSSVAYIESAGLLSREGKDDSAIALLESALPKVGTNDTDDITRSLGELYLHVATAASQAGKRWPRLTEARNRFESAVKQWPDDQGMRLMLGNLRALDNDIAGAISCYDVLEKKNPDDLMIKEKLAISLMATGNKTGAVSALEAIASRQPTNGRVFFFLGELYEQLGETNKAVLNYDLAGKNLRDDPLPFLKSSILNVASARYGEAEAILRKGLEGAPGQPRLQEMLAYVLLDEKKYAESLPYFAKAAATVAVADGKTLTENFRANYAIALHLCGKLDDAAAMLVEAVQTNSAAVDAYASYMMRDGHPTNLAIAVEILSRVEEKLPGFPRAPMFRGLLLSSLDRYAEAIGAFERAEKTGAKSPQPEKVLTSPFYFWYGAACERITNIDRSASLFLKAIALNPGNAEARNYLAYMWAERSIHLDEALDQIQKALHDEPDNPAYLDTLGWIYFMKGDAAKALAETTRAVKAVDNDPTINDHMGDIVAKLGRASEALEYWKRAFICGNETPQLPVKLRAAGIDPKTLEAAAAAVRAQKAAQPKPAP